MEKRVDAQRVAAARKTVTIGKHIGNLIGHCYDRGSGAVRITSWGCYSGVPVVALLLSTRRTGYGGMNEGPRASLQDVSFAHDVSWDRPF
jgi:hypothetical protein